MSRRCSARQADVWEELLRGARWYGYLDGERHGFVPARFGAQQSASGGGRPLQNVEGIAQIPAAPPPTPVDYWAVFERSQRIERAGLVVVNLRDPDERPAAEQLLVELARLRKDDALINEIVGLRGYPLADQGGGRESLADPRDAGRKKKLSLGCVEQYARRCGHVASGDEELCVGLVGSHTGVRM